MYETRKREQYRAFDWKSSIPEEATIAFPDCLQLVLFAHLTSSTSRPHLNKHNLTFPDVELGTMVEVHTYLPRIVNARHLCVHTMNRSFQPCNTS